MGEKMRLMTAKKLKRLRNNPGKALLITVSHYIFEWNPFRSPMMIRVNKKSIRRMKNVQKFNTQRSVVASFLDFSFV